VLLGWVGGGNPGRWLGRQLELELVDQELQLGFRLGVAGQHEFAAVRGREMNVDHLDGSKFLDSTAGGQARRQGVQAALQRDV
jgi:hypothetical protein